MGDESRKFLREFQREIESFILWSITPVKQNSYYNEKYIECASFEDCNWASNIHQVLDFLFIIYSAGLQIAWFSIKLNKAPYEH